MGGNGDKVMAGGTPTNPAALVLWQGALLLYSHSMVPGGLLVMSKTTRLTPFTSFTIRLLMRASTSYGTRAQSAVIASSLVTTRTATTLAYVRKSPITPTVSSGVSTANDCHTWR